MGALVTLLFSALSTFLGKLITGFGISVIAYSGLDYMQSQFLSFISGEISGFPEACLDLFYLCGGGQVLNILFGAFAFIVSLKTISGVLSFATKR